MAMEHFSSFTATLCIAYCHHCGHSHNNTDMVAIVTHFTGMQMNKSWSGPGRLSTHSDRRVLCMVAGCVLGTELMHVIGRSPLRAFNHFCTLFLQLILTTKDMGNFSRFF